MFYEETMKLYGLKIIFLLPILYSQMYVRVVDIEKNKYSMFLIVVDMEKV